MTLAMDHAIHDVAWTQDRPGRHAGHAALLALFTQAEAGDHVPGEHDLRRGPGAAPAGDAGDAYVAKILGGRYDAPLRPVDEKRGVTVGMAMTEKQSGSDVRANTTRAYPLEGGGSLAFRLVGHKWFCSAPMSDAFLTLAYTAAGLSCFLVPRITPGGERNAGPSHAAEGQARQPVERVGRDRVP